ncbi:MAG: CvpA family protein [Clostridia bacterium]|nr:CvpA family protein [Clostridia bacterium]
MALTYIDIGILAILVIAFFVGIKKGFIDSILSLIGGLVSLIIAILLASTVVDLIGDTFGIRSSIQNWSVKFLTDLFNPEGVEGHLLTSPIGAENIENLIAQAMAQLKLPAAIADPISKALATAISGSIANTNVANSSLVDILAPVVTQAIMLVIAVILTFIVIRIVVAIVEAITKAILRTSSSLRGLNRLLGGVIGILKGALAVVIIFTIGSFVLGGVDPESESQDLKTQIRSTIDKSAIGSVIWESNPLPKYITDNINIEEILNKIIRGENNEPDPEGTPAPTAEATAEPTPQPTAETTPLPTEEP